MAIPDPAGVEVIHVETARQMLTAVEKAMPADLFVATAAVVEMLLDEESQHLAGLSDFIGKPISLRAEPFASPEQYDIVLL